MKISSAQCRAGRNLLAWSQNTLATNARISRATVSDFETNIRRPTTNNFLSIIDCMRAAGVEFLEEDNGSGVGVRFRKRKLEVIRKTKIIRDNAEISMEFGDNEFTCVITREVLDDFAGRNFVNEQQAQEIVAEKMHRIVMKAEGKCEDGFCDNRMYLKPVDFD